MYVLHIVIAQLHSVFPFQNSVVSFNPVDYKVTESSGYITLFLVQFLMPMLYCDHAGPRHI